MDASALENQAAGRRTRLLIQPRARRSAQSQNSRYGTQIVDAARNHRSTAGFDFVEDARDFGHGCQHTGPRGALLLSGHYRTFEMTHDNGVGGPLNDVFAPR